MKPTIVAAVLAALTAPAYAAEPKPVHVRGAVFAVGCLDTRDTDRAARLETEAIAHLARAGRCYLFYAYPAEDIAAGQPAIAFEESTKGDYGCVRPRGRPDCYWLRRDQYGEAVNPSAAPGNTSARAR